MIENSLEATIPEIIMLPIYGYLSIFHYGYSEVIYDVLFAPLYAIGLEKYMDMNKEYKSYQLIKRETGKEQELKIGKFGRWMLELLQE